MNSTAERWAGVPAPTARWARQVLVAVHVPVIIAPVLFTVLNQPNLFSVRGAVTPVSLGAVIGFLQVRHSLAATRGERAKGGLWTLLALAALIYVPMPWLGLNWGIGQTALIASALMILGGRAGSVVTAVVLGMWTTVTGQAYWGLGSVARWVFDVGGAVLFQAVIGVALYAAARLVRVLDELESARTELADLAVGRERLRVSRDLHDLLGQSLSAVSLKGDLAIRLLARDAPAARAEIESLTGVARDALRGVRAITRGAHTVSLRAEADGATALLGAAGVRVAENVTLDDLPAPVEDVLAWALREGVTNVLRHSQATNCTITANRRRATAWLEIVNDGAGPLSEDGSGLDGLTQRARALAGTVSSERTPEGTFRLVVEIPLRVSIEERL